jgi:hypothetical protein
VRQRDETTIEVWTLDVWSRIPILGLCDIYCYPKEQGSWEVTVSGVLLSAET